MKRIRFDWRWLPVLWAVWMLLLWAGSSVLADAHDEQPYIVHAPIAYGSTEYAARPASLPLPAGYRCFQQSSEYVRYAGYFYGSCVLNMPNSNPSGVLVYKSRDGVSSEFVLATGKGAGEGSFTLDTDGSLVLSYFVVAEQRQYLQVVQP